MKTQKVLELKKIIIIVCALLFSGMILLAVLSQIDSFKYTKELFIVFLVIAIGIVIGIPVYYHYVTNVKVDMFIDYLPTISKVLKSNVEYEEKPNVSIECIKDDPLIDWGKANREKIVNRLYGEYEGDKFETYHLYVYYDYHERDFENHSTTTIFNGYYINLFLKTKLHSTISIRTRDYIRVVPNNQNYKIYSLNKPLMPCQTGNQLIDEKFYINIEDINDKEYITSPEFVDVLLELKKVIPYEFSIFMRKDNQISLAIKEFEAFSLFNPYSFSNKEIDETTVYNSVINDANILKICLEKLYDLAK